jgi:serine/threonine protein kinase HipA of HipAB toxin-antitoxin module
MVMTSPIVIEPAGRPGVYDVTASFGMAGTWRMTIEWNGPAGRGSAVFGGNVQ